MPYMYANPIGFILTGGYWRLLVLVHARLDAGGMVEALVALGGSFSI